MGSSFSMRKLKNNCFRREPIKTRSNAERAQSRWSAAQRAIPLRRAASDRINARSREHLCAGSSLAQRGSNRRQRQSSQSKSAFREGNPDLSACKNPFVFVMRSDPKPVNRIAFEQAKRAIATRDTHRPYIADFLKAERIVLRIASPKSIRFPRILLGACRQGCEVLPEFSRCQGLHRAASPG